MTGFVNQLNDILSIIVKSSYFLYCVFSSQNNSESTDLSATLSAIFSSYSDSEDDEEEPILLPSTNLESMVSDEDFSLGHDDHVQPVAGATAVESSSGLHQQQRVLSPISTTLVESTVATNSHSNSAPSNITSSTTDAPQCNTELLQEKGKDVIEDFCSIDSQLQEFVSYFNKDRIICEVKKILDLFGKKLSNEKLCRPMFSVWYKI